MKKTAVRIALGFAAFLALALNLEASESLETAKTLYRGGQYFQAARYAFDAAGNAGEQAHGYAWTTKGLIRAGLFQSASYFFIRTLQTGDRAAIREVVPHTQELMVRVGPDLLRKYLIRHTKYDDYDLVNKSAFLFSLGKSSLLAGKEKDAIAYFNSMGKGSALWPYALQLRGTASAIVGSTENALKDFRECQTVAQSYRERLRDQSETRDGNRDVTAGWEKQTRAQARDLEIRCIASEARTLYQMDRFDEAERVYERVPKSSFVWTDILFEQAWNAFGQLEYNRTLGKLVSYKSPALQFVFNTEVDVLRAHTYLMLCLYNDADQVIREFTARYTPVGEEVKKFVEKNSNPSNLGAFYEEGKRVLAESIHTSRPFYRLMNRFVRSPYYQNLVDSEAVAKREMAAVASFGAGSERGLAGFLRNVLDWRVRTVQGLGGIFIKNSLLDYHAVLIADFEKMAFLRLEMLSRARNQIMGTTPASTDRSRGMREPVRRDDQYFWRFNGEFWNDELGDYIFGLESECQKN